MQNSTILSIQSKPSPGTILTESQKVRWEIQRIDACALTLSGSVTKPFGYGEDAGTAHLPARHELTLTYENQGLIDGKEATSALHFAGWVESTHLLPREGLDR